MNAIQRREFLAMGAMTLFPAALRAAEPLRLCRFVVVSDTDLGRKDNDQAERQWAKAAAELKAAPGDFILHLGDVVDGGRAAQYPIYRRIRDGIGKPVHEMPGNHDPVEVLKRRWR